MALLFATDIWVTDFGEGSVGSLDFPIIGVVVNAQDLQKGARLMKYEIQQVNRPSMLEIQGINGLV